MAVNSIYFVRKGSRGEIFAQSIKLTDLPFWLIDIIGDSQQAVDDGDGITACTVVSPLANWQAADLARHLLQIQPKESITALVSPKKSLISFPI